MACDKSKVINRFKSLFGTIGLSNTRLDEISAKLAGKLADEATDEQIDERINDLNEVYPYSEIKKNDDRTLNEKNNPNKKSQQEDKSENKEEIKVDDDAPAWAKALLKQNETLSSKLDAFEKKEQAKTITERFNSDPRVKDIPAFMRKGYIPANEEEFESNVEELIGEYKTFAEKNKLSTQGADTPGGSSSTKKTGEVKKLSPEQAKKVVESMNI